MQEKTAEKISRKEKSNPVNIKWIGTRILEDVFTDEIELLKSKFLTDTDRYLKRLWEANRDIYDILKRPEETEEIRDKLYTYLDRTERKIFDIDNDLHILEKSTVRECIRVFRSIIGPINEQRTGFSALKTLIRLARNESNGKDTEVSVGFILEFIYLFKGVKGNVNIYREESSTKRHVPEFLKLKGREAAEKRMEALDEIGMALQKYFKKYPSGLEDEVIEWRRDNRKKILKYFGGTEKDWKDYKWHLKNVIKDPKPLLDLIELSSAHKIAVEKAVKNKIPFGITPYYLSLMDSRLSIGYDHAIRAQVIPPKEYVDKMVEHKVDRDTSFDFMGEHDTSPVDLVTRRYPMIAIVKPFNTCAQICVYCQRNWEIERVLAPDAMATQKEIENALNWFDEHKSIGDILITGGDPLVMNDTQLEKILDIISKKEHIFRVRLGTRTPVVIPQRWTESLMNVLRKFHNPPKLEIAVVTHFEHSYEITPEAMKAVQKIKKAGISVYNQEVFTIENSRRFETAKLRRDMKAIGVDPYYTFNMKGKEETSRYMVPIARILQERKEEARLLPGLDRTDEPVFNVPRLGKNHLRAMQDHRLVMIMPDGTRIYEFHPWEKNITPVPPYNYHDVSIYAYLEKLAARGENISDYRTIWYYY